MRLYKLQGKWLRSRFGFANHLVLIACFNILGELG